MTDHRNLANVDLLALQSEINEELENRKAESLKEQQSANHKKLIYLSGVEQVLLDLLEHDRTSCSDENPQNGWEEDRGHARCAKCHLLEGRYTIFDSCHLNFYGSGTCSSSFCQLPWMQVSCRFDPSGAVLGPS